MLRTVSVEARQPLPIEWRVSYGLATVRRGIIIRQRIDSTGRASAIDIVGPGSVLPISALEDDGAAGYAVDDAKLCLAPTELIHLGTSRGEMAQDLLRAHATMLQRVERIAEARSRPTALAQVATLLVTICDTLTPTRLLKTPGALQQRDLGAVLAIRHESVCRALTRLEKEGLILRTEANELHLIDRAALEAI